MSRPAQAVTGCLFACALSGCQEAVLYPAGSVAHAERTILIDSVVIMLAIVLPVIVAILAFAWWFRASNSRARYRPEFVYSGRIELVVWSVPVMVITLLGGVAWIGSHMLDPAAPLPDKTPPLRIEGVSLDWKWLFIYPDQHIASVNQLVIPAGRPIRFDLTSASVMNVFFVPRLGSMIYTMNGMTTRLNLDTDQPGDFYGQSSHFSGDGFSDMNFIVHAVPEQQFENWVATTRNAGPGLDAASYQQLARQSRHVPPFTYRSADPALFEQIVTRKLPPAPGPGFAATAQPRVAAEAGLHGAGQ